MRYPIHESVTLQGHIARLEPCTAVHASDLAAEITAGDLHKLWYTWIPAPDQITAEIERRQAQADMVSFAIIDQKTEQAVGMSTYMNIDAPNRRLEIGSTWLGPSAQRSGINTEAKLLLLTRAFEVLDCIAVEFRTHYLNAQSRRAIERLGAKYDGMLRNHIIMANGTIRDTVVYSITANEWPTVKTNLSARYSA